MIIECINCNKIFEVNSELIPSSGRTIQCGSCGHVWFYKYDGFPINKQIEEKIINNKNDLKKKTKPKLKIKFYPKKLIKLLIKKIKL